MTRQENVFMKCILHCVFIFPWRLIFPAQPWMIDQLFDCFSLGKCSTAWGEGALLRQYTDSDGEAAAACPVFVNINISSLIRWWGCCVCVFVQVSLSDFCIYRLFCSNTHLWAEYSSAVTGYIFFIALVKETLRLLCSAALAWTFPIAVSGALAPMGKVTFGIAQVRGRARHTWWPILILIGRRLQLIQWRRPSHPLDTVYWCKAKWERWI